MKGDTINKQGYITKAIPLPNGKRKYVRARTQEELDKKVLKLQIELNAGIDISDNTTVAELIDTWITLYKQNRMKPQSLSSLRGMLDHIVKAIGGMKVKDVRPVHIQAMLNRLNGLSENYQSKIRSTAKAIFLTAVENGMIPRNPVTSTVECFGNPPEDKVPLSAEEIRLVLDTMRSTASISDCAMIRLMLCCALRIGEAAALHWSDVDLNKGFIHVRRTVVWSDQSVQDATKTKSGDRLIPLDLGTWETLKALRAEATSLMLFPGKNGRTPAYNTAAKPLEIVSKIVGRHINPHLLRHSRITDWFNDGLSVKETQYLAGHANASMTLDVYTHYVPQNQLQETAEKLREMVL